MIQDFINSIGAYRYATKFLFRHGLWVYALLPGILCTLLVAGLYYTTISWMNVETLEGKINMAIANWDGWFLGTIRGLIEAVVGLGAINLLVLLVFILVFFFFGKYLILIVASPFMGPVSEKVETIVRGQKAASTSHFLSDLWRGIRISVRNLLREMMFTLLFLLLNFIPVIGTIVGTVLTLAVQAFYAGFGSMDYTLERKGYNVSQSVRFVRRHNGLAVGNGAIFLLLMAIPFLGWFLAPAFATVAATVSTLEKVAHEKV